MQLPPLQGTFDQSDFFVYAACDRGYFAEFGSAFINSVKNNTDLDMHLHLFNPDPDQISYCQRHGVGVTWEHVHLPLFAPAAQRWNTVPALEPEKSRYQRTVTAMGKGQDRTVTERLQKTYFACARFIRLAELYKQQGVFAVDVDAVVRQPVTCPGNGHDFYIHHISGKKARYLAGGLWINAQGQGQQFLRKYAQELRGWFEQDYIYWGLDQDLLDVVVPRYNHGQLPMSLIDWNMHPDSAVWTAKGTRKESAVFINEREKYTV